MPPTRCTKAQLYAIMQRRAAMLSYIDAFLLLAAIVAALVPLVFLLRKPASGAALPAH
jgi:hypothetical protein